MEMISGSFELEGGRYFEDWTFFLSVFEFGLVLGSMKMRRFGLCSGAST